MRGQRIASSLLCKAFKAISAGSQFATESKIPSQTDVELTNITLPGIDHEMSQGEHS